MTKILIVEDNELNRDMLSRRLIRRGFGVVCAVDGGQALSMARAEKPDPILMDLRLPDIDGWGVTRALKSDQATGAIPIIALTAHAMEAHRDEAMKAGCDDYDTKPVDLPRLLEKINRLVGGAGHPQNQEPAARPAL